MKTTPTIATLLTPLALVAVALTAGCSGGNGPNPSGTLEATTVDIAPQVSGTVLSVDADEGDDVSAGDTLFVIDTSVIALERARTATQRAAIAAQRREAQARMRQAQSQLELAETTLDRTRRLVAKGSASQQQLDEATSRHDVAANNVAAARDRLSVLDAQDTELAAALAVYDRRLRDGVVLAPQSGTILVRAIEPGEVAVPGAMALRMADLHKLELRVFLDATDLARVELGQRLPVLVDALGGKPLQGTVSWIASESEFTPKNVQTRNARAQLVYAVKVRVDNPDGRLHIGMPAEVRLPRAQEASS